MSDYVKASPYFFRLIKIAFAGCLAMLLILAAFIQAPLQGPADVSRVPNPSKSAWFLMWTQELVSYSNAMLYLILGIGLTFLLLPWLPISPEAKTARWLCREQRSINALTLITFFGIVILTVIAMYFRGKNWSFVSGF